MNFIYIKIHGTTKIMQYYLNIFCDRVLKNALSIIGLFLQDISVTILRECGHKSHLQKRFIYLILRLAWSYRN